MKREGMTVLLCNFEFANIDILDNKHDKDMKSNIDNLLAFYTWQNLWINPACGTSNVFV